ncbi:MAG: type II/IV secretion system protein [Candidatus Gracilibacteria bacterium]|nr:type II/IV secretion system protein [Candidatus Gracilibacteria bacterium]
MDKKRSFSTEEKLKEKILNNEKKKNFSSEKFHKIEDQVKKSLAKQDTDEALKDITIGALVMGSSDIHFECSETFITLRFRIDGILVDILNFTKAEYKLLLERMKYASNMKLNITNIPQDGKYAFVIEEKKIDVRVSTLPIHFGENIVARILDNSKSVVDFEQLGFFWTSKRIVEQSIKKKNGLILVTGPTGSGKTTTLYTILSKLNSREKKIITLEDPIEYQLEGITQAEVSENTGFTFQTGLKALLRQDPDIIMVGEIRDKETLDTATTASLTGHLVLSTLHTKSAAETLDRIINMGLRPYVLASAIDTIIAQRLVRKICPHCKQEKTQTPTESQLIDTIMKDIGINHLPSKFVKLYEGKGCEKCGDTGYLGRIGIYEIISLNENLKTLIRDGGSTEEILGEARHGDFISLKEDGVLKAIKGFTTIEELLRVI